MTRVLITYFSQTGNTEKNARAMHAALKDECDTREQKLEDVAAGETGGYDFIFIGTPCIAGDISVQVKDFIGGLPHAPRFRIALFLTHSAPSYRQEDFTKCIATMETLCGEKSIELVKTFDCQGFLDPRIHDMVKKMKKFSDEEWEKNLAQMKGHPDARDERNAARFAREVVGL